MPRASKVVNPPSAPSAKDLAGSVPAGLTVKLKKAHREEQAKAERDISWPDFVRESGYELNDAGHVVERR